MYVLSIVRYDTNFGDINTYMPIKTLTRSMCETIYTETVTEDKHYLLIEYGDEDNIFEYTLRIDEYEGLLFIKKTFD
jgi:hypothetical protein